MTREKFTEIVSYLSTVIRGTEYDNHVFVVGGAVRDYVMGNEIKDVDMCVDIENGGIEFANWLKFHGLVNGSVIIYETYGTAMFHLRAFPEDEIEVVQTRGEQYHDKNSRNPQVTFASLMDDCVRRDLTMNALYMSVSSQKVLDLTGHGLEDIKNHVCRVTNDNPDVVFDDDPLRIMRVIRFSSKYDFDIDPKTMESMMKFVDRLSIISQERISDEFKKMVMCKNPGKAMRLLKQTGAMKYVIPEMEDTYDMEQNSFHFGPVWDHTLGVIDNCTSNNPAVRMACILHDIGKIKCQSRGNDGRVHFYDHEAIGADMARDILIRMRFPKTFADEVAFYVKWHMLTKQWGDDIKHMKPKALRKLQYICGSDERFENLMSVIDADNNAHHPDHCLPNQVRNISSYVKDTQPEDEKMYQYKLPINGNDIMKELGIKSGPDLKKYLDHCMKLAFNNPGITREELLHHIKYDKISGIERPNQKNPQTIDNSKESVEDLNEVIRRSVEKTLMKYLK